MLVLIDVERCGGLRGLVARPGGGERHVAVTDKAAVPRDYVGVAALAVAPVRRVLRVVRARDLLRSVHCHWLGIGDGDGYALRPTRLIIARRNKSDRCK